MSDIGAAAIREAISAADDSGDRIAAASYQLDSAAIAYGEAVLDGTRGPALNRLLREMKLNAVALSSVLRDKRAAR